MSASQILWQPSPERVADGNLSAFARQITERCGVSFDGYESLHHWSVTHIPEFWSFLWEFCGIIGEAGSVVVDNPNKLPGARWFPKGSLNYAENLLRPRRETDDVLVFRGEDKVETRFSYKDVHDTVSRIQQALKAAGVRKGDRIAALHAEYARNRHVYVGGNGVGGGLVLGFP